MAAHADAADPPTLDIVAVRPAFLWRHACLGDAGAAHKCDLCLRALSDAPGAGDATLPNGATGDVAVHKTCGAALHFACLNAFFLRPKQDANDAMGCPKCAASWAPASKPAEYAALNVWVRDTGDGVMRVPTEPSRPKTRRVVTWVSVDPQSHADVPYAPDIAATIEAAFQKDKSARVPIVVAGLAFTVDCGGMVQKNASGGSRPVQRKAVDVPVAS